MEERQPFCGRMILPLIFTHQDQINGKTERNPKIQQATRCYHEAQADGFWVVDKTLTDDNGSRTLRNIRFPAIISLHQEINEAIPSKIRVAGPYWGLNLVLWARGWLITRRLALATPINTTWQEGMPVNQAHVWR